MPLSATALVSLAEAKEMLEIASSDQDSYIETLIERVSKTVERRTKRKIKSRSYANELYDGTGTRCLRLREWPITAIAGIDFSLDGGLTWEAQDLTNIVIDPYTSREIRFADQRVFWCGKLNIRVDYTAGIDPIPEELKDEVLRVIARRHRMKTKNEDGVVAVSYQGQRVDYETPEQLLWESPVFESYTRRDL